MDAPISGYAAVFDRETDIGGLFREVIRPGAFSTAITRGDDVRALFNHDPNLVLGRTKAGKLRLSQDERGLKYDISPPTATWAGDLRESIKRGDVSQSSFAFRVHQERWTSGHLPLREVLEAELFDVSPVTYPAYAATTVSARADGIELAGSAGGEGRSAITDSLDALRRLRVLAAAPSACERCRVGTAARLIGEREHRRMVFSHVCSDCSERMHLDRRARGRRPSMADRRLRLALAAREIGI